MFLVCKMRTGFCGNVPPQDWPFRPTSCVGQAHQSWNVIDLLGLDWARAQPYLSALKQMQTLALNPGRLVHNKPNTIALDTPTDVPHHHVLLHSLRLLAHSLVLLTPWTIWASTIAPHSSAPFRASATQNICTRLVVSFVYIGWFPLSRSALVSQQARRILDWYIRSWGSSNIRPLFIVVLLWETIGRGKEPMIESASRIWVLSKVKNVSQPKSKLINLIFLRRHT